MLRPVALLLLAATLASAQTTGVEPGLDLPIEALDRAPKEPDPTDPKDEEPPIIYGEEIPCESDTIFYVLDISCSMDWDPASYVDLSGDLRRGPRIDRAKVELTRSILGLSENFSFDIIAYDCGTRLWSQDLLPATPANKAAATGWVAALRPTGATGTGPATALALSERENLSVVLLTDGAPNCGAGGWSDTIDAHRQLIRAANLQRATITVFGIAAGGEYRAFCQNVAADSGGAYFDVP